MAFTYNKLANRILDQLMGFSTANAIIQSYRYLGETVLGDPSVNGDKPSANAANNFREKTTRATGASPGLGGVAISSSSGTFSTSSTTYVDITNLTITLVTAGRPVFISCIPDNSGAGSFWSASVDVGASEDDATAICFVSLLRDSTLIGEHTLEISGRSNSIGQLLNVYPASAISFIDTVGAGTYVYKLQGKANPDTLSSTRIKMIAFEL